MITCMEKFNLFMSHIICNLFYYLRLDTRAVYRYDYNLISASFRRKRKAAKNNENKRT